MHPPDPARDVSRVPNPTRGASQPTHPPTYPWRWMGLVLACLVGVLGTLRPGAKDRDPDAGHAPEGHPPALIHEASAQAHPRLRGALIGRGNTPERDINARFAARLAGLNVHGGVLQMLRMGTWQLTVADAVQASPQWVEEPMQRILEAAGATRAEGEQVLFQYPVTLDDPQEDPHADGVQAATAYPQIVQALQQALAPWHHAALRDPRSLDLLATEGLRCAWLTSCSVGALRELAEFIAQDLQELGLPVGNAEVRDCERQAADVARWCAEYFAARFVELHQLEPAAAMQLASALGRIEEGQQATTLQLFPARDGRD